MFVSSCNDTYSHRYILILNKIVDVPCMLHHDRDSTALTTRASGLGWTSAGLPHIQGVYRNLRTSL